MTTLTVYPSLNSNGVSLEVYAEDGVTLIMPHIGVAVSFAGEVPEYYAKKLNLGVISTFNPLSTSGNPITVDDRAYSFTPEMFGAAGDGVTDDTIAFQAALDFVAYTGGGRIVLSKNYLVDEVEAFSCTTVEGNGHEVGLIQKHTVATDGSCIFVGKNNRGTSNPVDNQHDIIFRNFAIRGQVATYGFLQFKHLMYLSGASDVLVENVLFYGFQGDGADTSYGDGTVERHNERITFRKCIFDGVNKDNRNAISIVEGSSILVEDCKFFNCSRSDQPGPIDIEPNDGDIFPRIRDITIRNNVFSNCGGNVGLIGMIMHETQSAMTVPCRGITVEGNFFDSDNTNPTAIALIQKQNAGATTISQGVTVRGNWAKGGSFRAYNCGGLRSARFMGNDWVGLAGGAIFGAVGQDSNYDLVFSGAERFFQCGQVSDTVFSFSDNEKVLFGDIIIDACGLPAGSAGVAIVLVAGAVTSDLNFSGLTTVGGGRMSNAVVLQPGHTMNTSQNRKKGWRLNGLGSDFIALATGEELIAQVSAATVGAINILDKASYKSAPFSVPGVNGYDPVRVSGSADLKGCQLSAYVSAADTVVFVINNLTGSTQNLAGMDYTVWAVKS